MVVMLGVFLSCDAGARVAGPGWGDINGCPLPVSSEKLTVGNHTFAVVISGLLLLAGKIDSFIFFDVFGNPP